MSDFSHIEAILTLAEREVIGHEPSQHRCGVYYALLQESLPYLRELLTHAKAKAEGLAVLRRELEIAESNASERSDPASNEENDAEIRRLREVIARHEVTA
jgi:hypothetical protein